MRSMRPVFEPPSSFVRIAILILLLIGLMTAGGGAFAQEKGTAWTEMIQKEKMPFDATKRDLKAYIHNQPERMNRISEETERLSQEAMRLSISYNLLEGNPIEMRDTARQMTILRDKALLLVAPVKGELAALGDLKKILVGHLGEYERLAADKSIPGGHEVIEQHVADVKETIALLDTASNIIDIIPNAAEQMVTRLRPRRVMIENDLEAAWKKYFLAPPFPGLFTADAWKTAQILLKNWAGFSAYWLIPYSENKNTIVSVLSKGALFSLVMLIAFAVVLAHLRRRFPSVPVVGHFLPFCCCTALGMPLIIIGITTSFGPLSMLSFPAEIILSAGLVSLGWNLRRLSSDDPATYKHNPLWPFWVVFAAGILVQLFHIPMMGYSPPLAFLFILAGVYSHVLQRRDQHVLDRKLLVITAWLSFTLAAATVFGLIHLSMLVATVWFAVALNIELGAGLWGCLNRIRELGKERATTARRLAEGVAFPMIFLGLFTVTVLWVTLYIGGMPLAGRIIQWHVTIGYLSLNLPMVVVVVAILFITRSLVVLVNALITFFAGKAGEGVLGEGVVKSLHAIATYVIWALYILLSLKLIGVSVAHLAIIAGGLSIGAGFGLQDLIKNFFSGLILLFGRSIHPGDELQVENVRGTVTRINIRNTIVQTNDDSTIFIPNSDLISKNITNWTYRDPRGRVEIAVGVAYGSDTDLVKELLLNCAASHPGVLKEPPPYVLFWDFGDSALAFRLRFWVMRPVLTRDKISSAIRFEIEKVFKENNIEIAFPQQDIHIRSTEGLMPCPEPDRAP